MSAAMRYSKGRSKKGGTLGVKTPSILFDDPFLRRLARSERSRAVSDLSLSTRAVNCLRRVRIRTIGKLVTAAREGFTAPRSAGRKTTSDIQNALKSLSDSIRSDGGIDWDLYAAARAATSLNSQKALPKPNSVRSPVLQVRSLASDGLMPAYRESRLEALHLSHRACTSLRRLGINTVGKLVHSVREGISHLPGAADQTIGEIKRALHALSQSIRIDGSVDWMNYASEHDLTILPKKNYAQLSPTHFLKMLPQVLTEAVESRYGANGGLVLRNYLLQRAQQRQSFETMAQKSGYTKQGVALIKKRIMTTLRDAILNDSYGGCQFRFRDSFVALFQQLDAALRIAQTRPLLYSEWETIIGRLWNIRPEQIEPFESFIFDMLRYHLVHSGSSRFERILLPRDKNTLPFTSASPAAARLLRYRFPNGLSRKQLVEELEKFINLRLSDAEIAAVVGSIPGVEKLKSGNRFQAPLADITRLTDQLERLLRTKGAPMHIREMSAEIRQVARTPRQMRTERRVSASLNSQKRFKPIARTGYWILSEWTGFETRTASEIAAEILSKSGKPMTEAQLHVLISDRRLVSRRSIGTLLRQDGRFRRVAPGTWRLKSQVG
jgi:hypothetical protein